MISLADNAFSLSLVSFLALTAPCLAESEITVPLAMSRCHLSDVNTSNEQTLKRVVTDCSEALKLRGASSEERGKAFMLRGVAHRNLGRLHLSLADLNNAVRLAPKNAPIVRMRAWTNRELGKLDAAEQDYDLALSIEPEWQGYLSRCVVRIDLKAYENASQDCKAALELDRNLDSLFFSAWLYVRKGENELAIDLLEEARRIPDAPSRVFDELAAAYLSAGKPANAGDAMRDGLSRFPDDSELKSRQKELQKLD